MAETVRDFVREIQREVRDTDLLPDRAAALLTRMTGLLGNVNDEIRVADMEYATVLLGYLETESKANRATIRAEISPEYARKREARDLKELAVELIRSLKYYLRAKEEEMRLSR
jgi:hypothetical protein